LNSLIKDLSSRRDKKLIRREKIPHEKISPIRIPGSSNPGIYRENGSENKIIPRF
jgi:hypothetical protein